MKKIFSLVAFVIFSLFCFTLQPANAVNMKDYVILVYMNGSNLESDKAQATKAINEMINVSGDEKFPGTFIVETGGTNIWHKNELVNTKNQRFLIKDGKIQQMTKLPSKSMGDSENFKEFLIFGMNQQEAKHYILVFWNHGEGSLKGFGYDELNKNDTLTLNEMETAFKDAKINKKFDLIGFDTCLMSTIETAQLLSKYGDYMLASQETEKQGGWNYNNFSKLSDQSITIEKLAKSIMDEYIVGENYYSITLLNLKKVDNLTKVLENALSRWENRMDILSIKTLSLRKDMLDFGGNINQKTNYIYPEMVDLDEVVLSFTGTNKEYLKEYSNAKKDAIIYHLSLGYDKNPSGINIFLPYGNNFTKKDLNLYKTSGFSSKYLEFVEKYYDALNSKNKFTVANAPKMDDSGTCTLKTEPNNINAAYVSLFKPLEERKYLSLGYIKHDTKINKNTGTIKASMPEEWFYALNQPIYVIETSKNNYISPMLLKRNNKERMVNVEFIYKDGKFRITKISEVDDKITTSRTLDAFGQGDILTPIFPIFKFNEINKKFITNLKPISYQKGTEKSVIINNIIGLRMQELDKADYQLRIMFENLQGEQAYSLPCIDK